MTKFDGELDYRLDRWLSYSVQSIKYRKYIPTLPSKYADITERIQRNVT